MIPPFTIRSRSIPSRFLISAALVLSVAAAVTTVALAQGDRPGVLADVVASGSPSPTPGIAAVGPTPVGQMPDRPAAGPTHATGRITGQRIYPGERIPDDFTICAINLASGQASCLGGNQLEYQLVLPPGQYQIYAVVPSFNPTYKAYYSRFIACGLRAECTDHTPIVVSVPAGGTTSGVDVGDFYL